MKKFHEILNEQRLTEDLVSDVLAVVPNQGRPIANAMFNFGRKPETSFSMFSLRKDGWLRGERYDNGMMFRTVKLLKGREYMPSHEVYAISFLYYPIEYTGYGEFREDIKANWKRDKGWIWLVRGQGMPTINTFISWMNKQIGNWVP